MGTFVSDAKRLFGTSNLYQILQLNNKRTSKYTEKQIKKAYLEQSLKYHPDRAEEKEKAERTEQFQILSRAYAILSDNERKAIYDETGVIEEDEISEECNWEVYCKRMFRKVTIEEVELFLKQYRDTGEETKDLKASYVRNKGDMGKIMEEVLGVTYEDEDRLKNLIDEMIKAGELKALPKFVNETVTKKKRRRKAAEKEAQEAKEALQEIEAREGTSDLFALIQARQKRAGSSLDAFCDSLAEKYGKPKLKKKRAK